MKTLKRKPVILLLVTLMAAMTFMTSCDELLEGFYPELAEGDIMVYIEFDDNLYGVSNFVNENSDIKVALIPFLETYDDFYMDEDNIEVESLYYGDFNNRQAELSFDPQDNRIYKIIVWLDIVNDGEPDWSDGGADEPSTLATNNWNGEWWIDNRWGMDEDGVEMSAYLSVGDDINHEQLFSHPDNAVGDEGGGKPPVAEAWASRTTVAAGDYVEFWETSWDPDGFIVDREWHISGTDTDETFNQPNLTFSFHNTGDYFVTLQVQDNDGNYSDTTSPIRITVVETFYNQGPTSDFWADMYYIEAGQTVRFQSGSWDPDDGIMEWYWNFNDGIEYFGGEVEWHTFDNVGTYNVSLRVTDWSGETDTSYLTINVSASGMANRSLNVTGSISTAIDPYYAPVRIRLYSLNNNPGMEFASKEIWGKYSYNETFDYLPEDDYTVMIWWDENNNWNPDPGEPGAFADGTDSSGTWWLDLYGDNVPYFAVYSVENYTWNSSFYFDDDDYLFGAASGGSEGSPTSPLGLGINTIHYGGYVAQGEYSYYWLDNLDLYTTSSLEILLQNLSDDVDLEVYGSSMDTSNYQEAYNAGALTTIGSGYNGGTTPEFVNVPSNHGYNSIFILVYGYEAGNYNVNIMTY